MPSQIKFPTARQRKELMQQLHALEAQEGHEFGQSELYQQYVTSLKALSDRMDQLSDTTATGIPPALTQQNVDELLQLIQTAAENGEQFLGKVQESKHSITKGIPGVVHQLQTILSDDFNSLSDYNPDEPKSLPEIQEGSRRKTIDLRNTNIRPIGNNSSSRIPMAVVNARGQRRDGVFTKASYAHLTERFNNILQRASDQCDEAGKAEMSKFLPTLRAKLIRMGETKRDGSRLTQNDPDEIFMARLIMIFDRCYREVDGPIPVDDLKATLMAYTGIDPDRLPSKALKILSEEFGIAKDEPSIEITFWNLGLKENDRLDQRNTCLSSIASLLGVGHLVARSDNMKCLDENGNTVEGTFMDFAKGLDLCGEPSLLKHVNSAPLDNPATRKKLLRQLADLQIVDFLSLNVDRHEGNMLYQVDDKGNIIGIEAIDNDSSFGNRSHTAQDARALRIISKDMKNKIMKLTPEMLKFSLRGRGLSQQEMDMAVKRLAALKNAITKKMIRTVEDKDLETITFDELEPPEGKRNAFNRVKEFMEESIQAKIDYRVGFEPLRGEYVPKLTEVSTTERRFTLGGLNDTLGLVEGLNRKNPKIITIRGKSPQFGKLVAAVKEASALHLDLKQNSWFRKTQQALMLTDVRAVKTITNQFRPTFKKLSETAAAYLNYKLEEKGVDTLEELVGKNSYEQSHIDYAKQILEITSEYNKQIDGPSNTEERDIMVSENEIRELEDRRSFMEKMKNPELIEKAPEKNTEQEVQKEILEEMNRILKK